MNRSRIFRHSLICASFLSLVVNASCSAEPRIEHVEVDGDVRKATATDVRRTVRQGPLSAPGDGESAKPAHALPVCDPPQVDEAYPGERWQTVYADSQGWSEEKLERAWSRARQGHYSAGMLVQEGRVIGWFGDVDRPYEAASIRKSMLSALVGQLVAEGKLSLDSSLEELRITEKPPLNALERSATLRDLLMSRSGIYRQAAYSLPSQEEERPKPGAHRPGEHFYYNNWDFNALGTIVEHAAGKTVFELFGERIAVPIGMQDYSLDDTRYVRDPESLHPAYLFRLSTRDRARFGHLYLRDGCWAGRQVVPSAWVRNSTAPLTDRSDELDYGYLWWSQEGIETMGLRERIFMARGNPLQYIMVFPEIDAVLVLTADRNYPGWINWIRSRIGLAPEWEDYAETLSLVMDSRVASPEAQVGGTK